MSNKPNLPIVRLPPVVAGGAGGGGRGGGGGKKKPIDPMAAYLRLKAAADRGDARAQAEMIKLQTLLTNAQIDLAPPVQVSGMPDEDDDEADVIDRVRGMDPIEAYEHIKQSMPYSDDLARKALLKKAYVASLGQEAAFVRTNPQSMMNGMLGNYAIVAAGDDPTQVCNWTGIDAETQPVNITVAPVEQLVAGAPEGLASTIARPFARIQFGTRGFSVSFDVDIGLGRQLVVGASSVIVQVGMDPVPPSGGTAGEMKLAGMLSFRPTIRVTPVTRTVYVDVVTGAKTQTFPIPPFAQRVSWYFQNTAATLTQLEVQDINHGTLYTEEITADAGGGGVIPNVELSSDAVFVKVHASGAGVLDIHGRLIFDLNF